MTYVGNQVQRNARRLFDDRYGGCRTAVMAMICCDQNAAELVNGVLNGTQYEFERIYSALMVARACLGLPAEGQA